jgi:hypothetical protein
MSARTFPIIHTNFRLDIKLEERTKLHIHEEIIPENLYKLTEAIREDGCFKHPVIIDSETLVVLDGMHRVAAACLLECQFIPVCLVEYKNPQITIGGWYRLIDCSSNFDKVVRRVKNIGFICEESGIETANKLVNERKAATAIVTRNRCVVVYGSQKSIKGIYDEVKRIETELRSKGYSISYDTEKDGREKIFSNSRFCMFIVPKVEKREVVREALKGEVFTHKTTRHVIPIRPLFVNASLDSLYGKLSLKKTNEKFVEQLSEKKMTFRPPGQILDRRYEEELCVFE